MTSAQVISFDDFGALEAHLHTLLDHHKELAAKYREALGEIMRGGDKVDEKWSQEMSVVLAGEKPKVAKEKPRLIGGAKKESKDQNQAWVPFDPFSVYTGNSASGAAELYFEAINQLDDTARRIQLSIDIMNTLRSRFSAPGSISLTVSFVNDAPSKMILKPVARDLQKKSLAFSFSVPAAAPVLR